MDVNDTLQQTRIPLAHGAGLLPAVGFATPVCHPMVARQAVRVALEAGFRHLDCAEVDRNEDVIGAAMQDAVLAGMVRRQDLFVTTKLWNNNHRPGRVRPALEASLRRLRLDHVDSYLIHTPFAFPPGEEQHPRDARGQDVYDSGVTLIETWQAMERLVDQGLCRSIGLSGIRLEKLKEIVAAARIMPAVVQIVSHPYLPQWDLLDFCRQHGIAMVAAAPLGDGARPRVTDDPLITAIARREHMTPTQVVLAWAIRRGTGFLAASTAPSQIRAAFDVPALSDSVLQEMRDGVTTRVFCPYRRRVKSLTDIPAEAGGAVPLGRGHMF